MNISSWTERKEQLQEKYGARKYHEGHRHIIASIKRALTQNRLASIKMAACHLHKNPDQVPAVVNKLNALIGHCYLSFQWMPDDNGEPAALVIRNGSIGLLVKTDPDSLPEGMMLTPIEPETFCSLTPEAALSALSSQACREPAFTRAPASARNTHLQLLRSDFEGLVQNN